MKITERLLKKHEACPEGMDWLKNQNTSNINDLMDAALSENHFNWANWMITRILKKENLIKYALYSAKLVLPIFEARYPSNKKPRKAIEEAQKYIENNTAYNAADAADAADAAYAAASDTAYDTAYAAAYAAYAAADAAYTATYAAASAAYTAYTAYDTADAANAAYTAANAAYATADAANAAYAAAYTAYASNAAAYASNAADAITNPNAKIKSIKRKILEYGAHLACFK